jgi:hypothetical protein
VANRAKIITVRVARLSWEGPASAESERTFGLIAPLLRLT